MKVLNLSCSQSHLFEGWFGSEDEFQAQVGSGLVACPLCGDTGIDKLPSAPRLNLGVAQADEAARAPVVNAPEHEIQAAWMRMVKHVVANTEDVGARFAEEARRIHHGEVPERGIRGEASREETQALLEEGISVLPLPVPKGLKGPLQ